MKQNKWFGIKRFRMRNAGDGHEIQLGSFGFWIHLEKTKSHNLDTWIAGEFDFPRTIRKGGWISVQAGKFTFSMSFDDPNSFEVGQEYER